MKVHVLDHIHQAIDQISTYVDSILEMLANPYKQGSPQLLGDEEHQYIEKISSNATLIKNVVNSISESMPEQNENNEKLSEYFKTVRHTVRNYINLMKGFAEIIIDNFHTQPSNLDSQKFQTILTYSNKILHLVSELQFEPPPLEEQQHSVSTSVDAKSETDDSTHDLEENTEEIIEFKKNFSILIVDDELENCELIKHILVKSGYQNNLFAHDAFEAKKIIFEKTPDLVLLDINMPVLNGIELLESLKFEIENRRLMVVMVTGEDTLENAIKCIKLGAEDFLTKPIDAAMLKVRINTCVRKRWFLFKENEYAKHLEMERKRYENLLKSIFPRTIVKELSETGQVKAREYNNVALLFVDVVNFTYFCDTHPVEDTMQGIQDFSEICESAAIEYNLQKIKTIGDGFLAIAGMLTKHDNSVMDCVSCAIAILKNTKNSSSHWLVRAGIDYGTIIGGVVGHRQYLFDVWGDPVNTAARVQAIANPDTICLTNRAWDKIKDICVGNSLDFIQLKGKTHPIEIIQFVKKN